MRSTRPALRLSEPPSYNAPFYADPWGQDSGSPTSETAHSDYYGTRSTASSSRTSSTCSHVVPEAAFLARSGGGDVQYIVDPYFGYKDIADLCTAYLVKAFRSHEETESSQRLGQPRLPIFIAQLMHITGVPLKVVIAALILLQRFRNLQPPNDTRSFSGHRLFIGALMLACNDDNLQNMMAHDASSAAYWSEISLFSEAELDEVFNTLYDELDGNVVVFPSYAAALEKLNNPLAIKSFEGDLDFVSSDETGLDWEDGNVSPTLSMSSTSMPPPEARQDKLRSRGGGTTAPQKQTRNVPSVRTRIASLFGKKARTC
ncbi:hypothetical protein CC1G_15176 [Coprinopsis cinerea okayama7|uniref:Cyclin N-terminal domain-containing protein n=1 Tax=Coprinopsis cinerea (strain Okayama-7 / 130 / ATCC MYA-4618 / FGSC 9003) TaxID=240176 RepID=D6RPI5_COPC7|nr:hypothetical protein CC1G_15176 [Coprinopsis cinerea okayama7\|eukprot:XP_002910537.1 hypothetical protein CC1G_15176 [Coprinopsis cinerea okayama7\